MLKTMPIPLESTIKSERLITAINLAFILIILAMNFAALPILKYVYALYFIFVVSTAAFSSFETSFPTALIYYFFEGQARILWNYHPVFRLSLDLILALIFIRTLIRDRKIEVKDSLPLIPLLFLLLHTLWYVIEVFNPSSVSSLSAIAATKIYIFPFLIFITLRQNKKYFNLEQLQKSSSLIMFLMACECALSLYQYAMGDEFLTKLSPFYLTAMKGDVFTAKDFRPFGTTFLPGVISVYLFLASGFFFIKKKFNLKNSIAITLLIILVTQTMLLTQVRSAQAKFILVLLGSLFVVVSTTNQSPIRRKILGIKVSLFGIGAFLLVYFVTTSNPLFQLGGALDRWNKIDSYEAAKAGRAGPEIAWQITTERLSKFPIGVGPGVTGAASSVTRDLLDHDPIYDRETFWGYDNLFLSLIVEFGYGAFFYIILILSLPIVLFRRFYFAKREGKLEQARIAGISAVIISVIIVGNWLAIGLPYNPESLMFWLWTAIGLNVTDKGQRDVSA